MAKKPSLTSYPAPKRTSRGTVSRPKAGPKPVLSPKLPPIHRDKQPL